jgi:hypothetical protein
MVGGFCSRPDLCFGIRSLLSDSFRCGAFASSLPGLSPD